MLPVAVRVVLIDDHEMLLESLCALLKLDRDIDVVGTATTLSEGERVVREQHPDVMVLDVDFPCGDAFDVVPGLLKVLPAVRVIFLSGHVSDVFVHQAVCVNARGYILKGEPSKTLRDAIKAVHSGSFAFSKPVAERLVFDSHDQRYRLKEDSPLCTLNLQDLEILRHLARGESVKQIALRLGRSEKSIDSQKYRIMSKLKIHDRVELARYAIREGLTLV